VYSSRRLHIASRGDGVTNRRKRSTPEVALADDDVGQMFFIIYWFVRWVTYSQFESEYARLTHG
jgi:hypothetical protein